jgi:site-specific recombinase XerD
MTTKQEALERLKSQIITGDRGHPEDKDALLEFEDRLALLKTKYGFGRREKLLRHCTIISEGSRTDEDADGNIVHEDPNGGKLTRIVEENDTEAAEDLVRWIHDNYDNPESNRDYRVAIRVFARRVLKLDDKADLPSAAAWIPATTDSGYDPTPTQEEILDWEEDVLPMIKAEKNPRTKALIALCFDTGARSGEVFDMRVGDFVDSDTGLKLTVDGKTGKRPIHLIPSVSYVNRWMSEHPGHSDDDYLWSNLDSTERISYRRFNQSLKDAAARVGVTKPVTPTAFRKASACWLASIGANAAFIEDRQGRERGSSAVARYIAHFGSKNETQYAHLLDMDIPDDKELVAGSIKPTICSRCGEHTPSPPAQHRCVWCGQALTPEGAERAEAQDDAITDRAFEEEPQSDMTDALRELREVLAEHPELRDASGVLDPEEDSSKS